MRKWDECGPRCELACKRAPTVPLVQPLGNSLHMATWRLTLGWLPLKTLPLLTKDPNIQLHRCTHILIIVATTARPLLISFQVGYYISFKLWRLCLRSILLGITCMCNNLKVSWEKVAFCHNVHEELRSLWGIDRVCSGIWCCFRVRGCNIPEGFAFVVGNPSHLGLHIEGDFKCGRQYTKWLLNFDAMSLDLLPDI